MTRFQSPFNERDRDYGYTLSNLRSPPCTSHWTICITVGYYWCR